MDYGPELGFLGSSPLPIEEILIAAYIPILLGNASP
jgi:hypothetical protein